jgi:hypothetical protein
MHPLIISCGFAIAFLAFPVRASIEIQPGLWEGTETGNFNGEQGEPEPISECIGPDDAKDIVKKLRADMMRKLQGQCSKLDVRENGNVVTLEVKCDDAQASVEATMTTTVQSMTSTRTAAQMIMTAGPQRAVVKMARQSKYVGPCKK